MVKLLGFLGCAISKSTNDVVEYFARHSLDSISLEIVNRHALSYVLVQVTVKCERSTRAGEAGNELPSSEDY